MALISDVKNNHNSYLLSSLEEMMKDKFMCDFIIIVNEDEFRVHRVILAGTSNYFKAMFSSEMKEAKEGFVQMIGIGSWAMRISIDFIYTGSASIDSDNVEEILSAATLMQLDGLADLCFHYLETNLEISTALRAVRLTNSYGRDPGTKIVEGFIIEHFKEILNEPQLSDISKEDLLRYIKSSGCGHLDSWKAMANWMANDIYSKKSLFAELLISLKIEDFPFEVLQPILDHSMLKKFPDMRSTLVERWTFEVVTFESHLNHKYQYVIKSLIEQHDLETKSDLMKCLSQYLAINFEKLWRVKGFCELSEEDILFVLQNKINQYFPETTKWRASTKWIQHNENRQKMLPVIFDSIDLHLLSRDFIRREILPHTLLKTSDNIKDRLLNHICSNPTSDSHLVSLDRYGGEITIVDPSEKNYTALTRVNGCIGIVNVCGDLYFPICGSSRFQSKAQDKLFRLNSGGKWTILPPPTKPINMLDKVIKYRRCIYIIGKELTQWFDPLRNDWSSKTCTEINEYACIVASDDCLYAVGGYKTQNRRNVPLNDAAKERYNLWGPGAASYKLPVNGHFT